MQAEQPVTDPSDSQHQRRIGPARGNSRGPLFRGRMPVDQGSTQAPWRGRDRSDRRAYWPASQTISPSPARPWQRVASDLAGTRFSSMAPRSWRSRSGPWRGSSPSVRDRACRLGAARVQSPGLRGTRNERRWAARGFSAGPASCLFPDRRARLRMQTPRAQSPESRVARSLRTARKAPCPCRRHRETGRSAALDPSRVPMRPQAPKPSPNPGQPRSGTALHPEQSPDRGSARDPIRPPATIESGSRRHCRRSHPAREAMKPRRSPGQGSWRLARQARYDRSTNRPCGPRTPRPGGRNGKRGARQPPWKERWRADGSNGRWHPGKFAQMPSRL